MILLTNLSSYLNAKVALDLALVFIIVYNFLLWIRNSQALNLVKGLFSILLVYLASQLIGLTTLNWLLAKFANGLILIVIIIFQPELRRILEKMGRGNFFTPSLLPGELQGAAIIKNILRAVDNLAKQKIGGLIVIEQSSILTEYIESGILLSANISSELLVSLFWPGSPTHDGAVIIRQNKIIAAECMLPLTDSKIPDRRLGTRHRAALGLSELSDAIIIVVSEETGIISLAENGNINRYLTKEALESRLFNLYTEDTLKKEKSFKIREFFSSKKVD